MVPVMMAFIPSRSPISRAIGGRHGRTFGLAQILDALQQMLLAHDIDHRRLFQIDLQRLVQRGVKNRVSRVVDKVSQDDRILRGLGPRSRWARRHLPRHPMPVQRQTGISTMPVQPQ